MTDIKTKGKSSYQIMKTNPIRDPKTIISPSRVQIIRKSLFFYVLSVVALSVFCITLGWRTLDHIGNGFIYGALFFVLFGILTLFGNTVPAQLSKLPLPKYSPPSIAPHKKTEMDGSASRNRGKELFLTSLICGALLSVTGLIFLKF